MRDEDAQTVPRSFGASPELLRQVAENAHDAIVVIRGDQRLFYNRAYLELTGCATDEELAARSPLSMIHPDDVSLVARHAAARQELDAPPAQYEFRGIRVDGTIRWLEVSSSLVEIDGQPASLGYLRDVTARKLAEEALRESEHRFRQLAEASLEGILIHEAGTVVDANAALSRMLGYSLAEMVGHHILELIHPEQQELARRQMLLSAYEPFELVLLGREQAIDVEVHAREVALQGRPARVVVVRDITRRKQMEAEIRAAALRDHLTGLHNRRGFEVLAEQQLKLALRSRRRLTLTFVDLDGLKPINDVLGHHAGDSALCDAAAVLRRVVRESDVVARLGGDEFAILKIDAAAETAQLFSSRLDEAIDAFNRTMGRPYTLSMSWGSASTEPDAPTTLDALLEQADARMYEHKRTRRAAVSTR